MMASTREYHDQKLVISSPALTPLDDLTPSEAVPAPWILTASILQSSACTYS